MASAILDKFSTSAPLTITLASLASSTVGVGRQSTIIDNTTTRYRDLLLFFKFTLGTTPTGSRAAYVYLIRSDKDATTPHRSDNAGPTDAAWTAQYARRIAVIPTKVSPSTGDVLMQEVEVSRPGPEWGIGIVHDTAVNFNGTGTNFWVRWIGLNPESQ